MPTLPVPPLLSRVSPLLLLVALAACTRERGYHPDSGVPENQAPIHKPDYRGGEVEPGELQPDPQAAAEPVRGEPPIAAEAEWSLDDEPPQWRITHVYIDVGLAEICGIAEAETHFDYDSAELDRQAEARVEALGECFTSGPLRDRELVLVGHTDPRGSDAYNRELGMSRAESVAQALQREGVSPARIDLASRGAAKAGDDPEAWDDDRRVDVRLADTGRS
jgi:outer membrane protein OmpA-like peptidoglycan-associated protein